MPTRRQSQRKPNPAPLPDYFIDLPIHEKVRALRAVKRWNQEELAREAQRHLHGGQRISRRGISGLESASDPEFSWPNGTYMHASHIIAVARALGVPPRYLDPNIGEHDDITQMRNLLNWIDPPGEEAATVQHVSQKPCSPIPAGLAAAGHGE